MAGLLLGVIYLSFISLGLPDSLLGSAWPTIQTEMELPVSYAGIVSAIICLGTVISSLMSDRLTFKFGTGRVTAFSIAMTALALFGFSLSHSFAALCLFAVPYGLGAGSVDASLNNYVALHYESRHMSWLHCMWGVGTVIGPTIMGLSLTAGRGWNNGYRTVGLLQVMAAAVVFGSLSMWKKRTADGTSAPHEPMKLSEVVRIPGVLYIMLAFFCYCSLESASLLWGSTYLVGVCGISETEAAALASLFCIGITAGRGISGFAAFRLNDSAMIRMGLGIIAAGIAVMLLPLGTVFREAGLVLVGLGCAPIYPSFIHLTPLCFGSDASQAVIGVQMASAYFGSCVMPPVFGLLAGYFSVRLFPAFLLVFLAMMAVMYMKLMNSMGNKEAIQTQKR